MYKNWAIPPGVCTYPSLYKYITASGGLMSTFETQTPIGMTPREILLDADAYEDPAEFKPERWLKPNTEKLRRNFIPFGRGSYMCIGMKYVHSLITV